MRRFRGWPAFFVIATILMCGIGLFAVVRGFGTPPEWRSPPSYPDAQQVKVQDFGAWGAHKAEYGDNIYVIKIITFTVADSPEKVKAFYRERYQGGGWKEDNWGRIVAAPDHINFTWAESRGNAPSVYFVDVITAAGSAGTNVEIGVSMFPGY